MLLCRMRLGLLRIAVDLAVAATSFFLLAIRFLVSMDDVDVLMKA